MKKRNLIFSIALFVFYATIITAMIASGSFYQKSSISGIFTFFTLFAAALNFMYWELENKEPPVKAAMTFIAGLIVLILKVEW